jgi:hypothetical protein
MATHTVENVTDGVRYINTVGGPIGLSPGEVGEKLEIAAGEMKIAKSTGWFKIDGKEGDAEDAPLADHPGIGEGAANSDTSDMDEAEPKPASKRR